MASAREEKVLETPPAYQVFNQGQYVAHDLAYKAAKKKVQIGSHITERGLNHTLIEINSGLPALRPFLLKPRDNSGTMYVLFRGTATIPGLVRNAELGGAGNKSLVAFSVRIIDALNNLILEYRKEFPDTKITVAIAGHSLGAADAQNFLVELMLAMLEHHGENLVVDEQITLQHIKELRLIAVNPAGATKSILRGKELGVRLAKFGIHTHRYWTYAHGDPVQQTGEMNFDAEREVGECHFLKVYYEYAGLYNPKVAHCTHYYTDNPPPGSRHEYFSNVTSEGEEAIRKELNYKSGLLQSYPIYLMQSVTDYFASWALQLYYGVQIPVSELPFTYQYVEVGGEEKNAVIALDPAHKARDDVVGVAQDYLVEIARGDVRALLREDVKILLEMFRAQQLLFPLPSPQLRMALAPQLNFLHGNESVERPEIYMPPSHRRSVARPRHPELKYAREEKHALIPLGDHALQLMQVEQKIPPPRIVIEVVEEPNVAAVEVIPTPPEVVLQPQVAVEEIIPAREMKLPDEKLEPADEKFIPPAFEQKPLDANNRIIMELDNINNRIQNEIKRVDDEKCQPIVKQSLQNVSNKIAEVKIALAHPLNPILPQAAKSDVLRSVKQNLIDNVQFGEPHRKKLRVFGRSIANMIMMIPVVGQLVRLCLHSTIKKTGSDYSGYFFGDQTKRQQFATQLQESVRRCSL